MHGAQVRGWILVDASPKLSPDTQTIAPLSTYESRRLARLMRRLQSIAAVRSVSESRVIPNPTLVVNGPHGAADTQATPVTNEDPFPTFGHAVFPVASVPNWGAMTTPAEWNRRYEEMSIDDFVPVPAYDLTVLTQPIAKLLRDRRAQVDCITAKLLYSTRYFGAYDIDADEFSGNHPGIDIKLAEGTPVGSVAGGRVASVSKRGGLGLAVIVEHRHPAGETFYSVYGHLEITTVRKGDTVSPGETIGTVGMTGKTTAPHLHLQIDQGKPGETHEPYFPLLMPSPKQANLFGIHPIDFVQRFGVPSTEAVAINE